MQFKDSREFKELLAKEVVREKLTPKSKMSYLAPYHHDPRYWDNYIQKEHGEN